MSDEQVKQAIINDSYQHPPEYVPVPKPRKKRQFLRWPLRLEQSRRIFASLLRKRNDEREGKTMARYSLKT